MRLRDRAIVVLVFFGLTGLPIRSAGQIQSPAAAGSWLDRPPTNWNHAGQGLPPPPQASNTGLLARCPPIGAAPTSAAAGQLRESGWIAFRPLDREIAQDDIEILAGMTDADGMCRPLRYQLFVFVGGRFAGTLSPQPMDSRADQSSGAVRLLPGGVVSIDFSRYTSTDALCCPSAHVNVRYRIDRAPAGPVVVPTEIRQTGR